MQQLAKCDTQCTGGDLSYAMAGSLAGTGSSVSDSGPMTVRILVGTLTADGSGTTELERETVALTDADTDAEALPAAFPFPLVPTGADIDTEGSLGIAKSPLLGSATLAVPAAVAYSDSLSPTHERANHRPPAMPLISRFAIRQCRTFLPLLSKGMAGAKPVNILIGVWTGNGFVGSG
jgi:hypothetical protein